MTEDERNAVIDVATITAELVRRLSAAYGSDWLQHFQLVVNAMETLSKINKG